MELELWRFLFDFRVSAEFEKVIVLKRPQGISGHSPKSSLHIEFFKYLVLKGIVLYFSLPFLKWTISLLLYEDKELSHLFYVELENVL